MNTPQHPVFSGLGSLHLWSALAALALPLSSHAGVSVVENTGTGATAWPGTPILSSAANPNSTFTVGESFSSTTSYDETFTIPAGTNYKLSSIRIFAGEGAGSSVSAPLTLGLYDLGGLYTAPNPSPLSLSVNLFGNGSGLPITYTTQTKGVLEFDFSGDDQVVLVGGHMYAFELVSANGTTPIYWYRNGADTYSGGAAYRGRSWINGNNARDMSLAVYGTVYTDPLPPTKCNVNGGTTYQTIDGFGAGAAYLYAGQSPLQQSWVDSLYGREGSEAGLSIIRLRITTDKAWANQLADGLKVKAYGGQILASPWTPPGEWKINTNTSYPAGNVGGSLDPSHYGDYANYLNEFAKYMSDGGAPLTVISLQNEPDFVPTDYDGCGWTSDQFHTFCLNYAGNITVPVMMPESYKSDISLSDATLNDANSAKNVQYIGEHLYGGAQKSYPLAASLGKHIWMTEFLLNDQTMDSALSTAVQVNDCLVTCNWNAYIWWKVIGDANGLLNNAGVMQNRGYVFAQFSRFVRPGDVRIDISDNTSSSLSLSAFRAPGGNRFAIVAINTTSNDLTHTFTLNGLSATFVKPWLTSATQHFAMQDEIAIADGKFTCTIPAKSIMTFVGNPDSSDYDGSAWYAPYNKGANGWIDSSWFGGFWLTGANYLYHSDLHWIYTAPSGNWLFAYAFNGLGWVATSESTYPYVYYYGVPAVGGSGTESGWAYVGKSGNGKTWLYFFGGSRASGGTDTNYPGWWAF